MFPNPASDSISVEISSELGTDAQLRILNENGAVLKTETVRLEKGSIVLQVSVNDFPAGTYYVMVFNENLVPTATKIVKQ